MYQAALLKIDYIDKRIEDLQRFIPKKSMEERIKEREKNRKKRMLNQLMRKEKENGVSSFSKFPHTPLSTLFKILENISKKLHLAKVEKIEYKVWDEIGERIYWLCNSVNQYNYYLNKFNLPLYLQK